MLSSVSLLLAVTTAVQQAAPAPAPHARAHKRARAITVMPFVAPVAALPAYRPDVRVVDRAQAPTVAMREVDPMSRRRERNAVGEFG